MKINQHRNKIAISYDRHFIEHGQEGALDYDNLPEYITSNPEYSSWKDVMEKGIHKSHIDIQGYLVPQQGMEFVSLGCGLNFIYKGYGDWPSNYHGVDISKETIAHLNRHWEQDKLRIASLHCTSIHSTPFPDDYFDIGECIGVIEYYKRDFVTAILSEIHRIMKPNSRFVLDIPNNDSPSGRMARVIEECMGRPDEFDLTPLEFEELLEQYFVIQDSDRMWAEQQGEVPQGIVCCYCLKNIS